MTVTPSILQGEFIGLEAKVVRSSNPSQVGMQGEVLNETQKTLTISRKGEDKRIAKETSTFQFTLPDKTVIEVDGKVLVGRPEDRAKKIVRRNW